MRLNTVGSVTSLEMKIVLTVELVAPFVSVAMISTV